MQDLNDFVTGGQLTAAQFNEIPSELQNVITALGQVLTSADLNQLGKAIAGYVGAADFYSVAGTANAPVLSAIGAIQAPPTYSPGQRIRFIAAFTNTGAMVISIGALTTRKIRDQFDADVVAGDFIAGNRYELYFEPAFDLGNGAFVLVKASAVSNILPRGFIDGLILSNNTIDAANDIDIAAGSCRASGNDVDFNLASALGKRIDAVWAQGGTPAATVGGFPSTLTGGVVQNNTWYRVFAIWKPSGQIDAGFDTAVNAANLLADAAGAGYTKYRQIGWVRRDVGTIRRFHQIGDNFVWDVLNEDYSVATIGTLLAVTVSLLAPPDESCEANINFMGGNVAGNLYILMTALRQTDTAPTDSINNYETDSNASERPINHTLPLNSLGQIRVRSSDVNARINIRTMGWNDPRGKQ